MSVIDDFQQAQRVFHDMIATDMHRLHDAGGLLPFLLLVGIGFVYGVFHAVGPGHGKVVVASYMLAGESSLRQGCLIALLSALLQAVVAIVLVLGAMLLLNLAYATTEHAATWLEIASFALILLVGLRLFWQGVREARRLVKPVHKHHHGHHQHYHDEACGCGHAHMPGPGELAKAKGWGDRAAMIVSVGLRPCSGAIIMLAFSCLIGVVGAGIAATFAMALGTALTTSALAMAAVYAKTRTIKALDASERTLGWLHLTLRLGGGLAVMLMALVFLAGGISAELSRPDTPQSAMPLMHMPGR